MNLEREYFPDCGEWSQQERDFAHRAIDSIGLSGWHALLEVQRSEGREAFLKRIRELWPDGSPPDKHS